LTATKAPEWSREHATLGSLKKLPARPILIEVGLRQREPAGHSDILAMKRHDDDVSASPVPLIGASAPSTSLNVVFYL
jgi:hypothetical protein